MRVFHIYADGKTVKEIPYETYRANWNKPSWKNRKIMFVWNTELNLSHHQSSQYIKRQQLEQVLKECWKD